MANLVQALYLASFVSGVVTLLLWVRRNSVQEEDLPAHRQRFRGWLITTMAFSALAAVCYLALSARA